MASRHYIWRWQQYALTAGLDTLLNTHHDVIVTPDNTVLFLAIDTGTVNDTVWEGEAIWEWDPATDVLTKRWTAKDFLTPKTDRGARTVPGDWLHANSLSIGPRGNILVSFVWNDPSKAAPVSPVELIGVTVKL